MLNGCKGVIFDFNGTLFFDSDKHVLAWNKLSEDLRGVGITPEELQTHFLWRSQQPCHRVPSAARM